MLPGFHPFLLGRNLLLYISPLWEASQKRGISLRMALPLMTLWNRVQLWALVAFWGAYCTGISFCASHSLSSCQTHPCSGCMGNPCWSNIPQTAHCKNSKETTAKSTLTWLLSPLLIFLTPHVCSWLLPKLSWLVFAKLIHTRVTLEKGTLILSY